MIGRAALYRGFVLFLIQWPCQENEIGNFCKCSDTTSIKMIQKYEKPSNLWTPLHEQCFVILPDWIWRKRKAWTQGSEKCLQERHQRPRGKRQVVHHLAAQLSRLRRKKWPLLDTWGWIPRSFKPCTVKCFGPRSCISCKIFRDNHPRFDQRTVHWLVL